MQVGDLVNQSIGSGLFPPPSLGPVGIVVRQGSTWQWGSHWLVLWANGEAPVSHADYDLEVISESR